MFAVVETQPEWILQETIHNNTDLFNTIFPFFLSHFCFESSKVLGSFPWILIFVIADIWTRRQLKLTPARLLQSSNAMKSFSFPNHNLLLLTLGGTRAAALPFLISHREERPPPNNIGRVIDDLAVGKRLLIKAKQTRAF